MAEIISQIKSSIVNSVRLMKENNGFRTIYYMEIQGTKRMINNEKDIPYLKNTINLINTIGKPSIGSLAYQFYESNNGKKLIELIECLYIESFEYKTFQGNLYDEDLRGTLDYVKLDLISRFPWSNNIFKDKRGVNHETKKIEFYSRRTGQFTVSLQSYLTSITGQKVFMDDLGNMDYINYIIKLIVASYIKEMLFFNTLEGRIFNGGSDFKELIRKGYLIYEN